MSHAHDSWNQVVARVKRERIRNGYYRRTEDSMNLTAPPMPFWFRVLHDNRDWLPVFAALVAIILFTWGVI